MAGVLPSTADDWKQAIDNLHLSAIRRIRQDVVTPATVVEVVKTRFKQYFRPVADGFAFGNLEEVVKANPEMATDICRQLADVADSGMQRVDFDFVNSENDDPIEVEDPLHSAKEDVLDLLETVSKHERVRDVMIPAASVSSPFLKKVMLYLLSTDSKLRERASDVICLWFGFAVDVSAEAVKAGFLALLATIERMGLEGLYFAAPLPLTVMQHALSLADDLVSSAGSKRVVSSFLTLMRPACLPSFYEKVSQAVAAAVEQDKGIAAELLQKLLKKYPVTHSRKLLFYLDLTELLLAHMPVTAFSAVQDELLAKLKVCLHSEHEQVVEQTCALCSNERVVGVFLINRRTVVPSLAPALSRAGRRYWNEVVNEQLDAVRHLFENMDNKLWTNAIKKAAEKEEETKKKKEERKEKWEKIELGQLKPSASTSSAANSGSAECADGESGHTDSGKSKHESSGEGSSAGEEVKSKKGEKKDESNGDHPPSAASASSSVPSLVRQRSRSKRSMRGKLAQMEEDSETSGKVGNGKSVSKKEEEEERKALSNATADVFSSPGGSPMPDVTVTAAVVPAAAPLPPVAAKVSTTDAKRDEGGEGKKQEKERTGAKEEVGREMKGVKQLTAAEMEGGKAKFEAASGSASSSSTGVAGGKSTQGKGGSSKGAEDNSKRGRGVANGSGVERGAKAEKEAEKERQVPVATTSIAHLSSSSTLPPSDGGVVTSPASSSSSTSGASSSGNEEAGVTTKVLSLQEISSSLDRGELRRARSAEMKDEEGDERVGEGVGGEDRPTFEHILAEETFAPPAEPTSWEEVEAHASGEEVRALQEQLAAERKRSEMLLRKLKQKEANELRQITRVKELEGMVRQLGVRVKMTSNAFHTIVAQQERSPPSYDVGGGKAVGGARGAAGRPHSASHSSMAIVSPSKKTASQRKIENLEAENEKLRTQLSSIVSARQTMEEKKQRLEREVEKMRVEIESAIQGHSEANPEVARIKSELELDRRLRELVDKNLGLRGEGIAARSRAQRLGRRDISPNARSKTVRLTGGGGAGRTAAAASGRGMTTAANARPSASLRSRPPF